jgi:2-polyprenyl-3-methyl-5-hydroxy-6-metoxy-1,4-benzoquinol methylase
MSTENYNKYHSYILSHEADFVWGIDTSANSIKWATKVFQKYKNGIYYSSQLTFDVIDVLTEDRELEAFDIVVCIEVIEHIADYEKLLEFIKKFCKKNKRGVYYEPPNATIVYISSPNRNHPKIRETQPRSNRHVREWTPQELYTVLTKHFKYVVAMNFKGEEKDLSMKDAVMLFKCETPIISK